MARGLFGVTGQVGTARRCQDGLLAVQSAERPAARTSEHPHRTAVADFAYTVAARPEEELGALDIGQLVRRAAEGDRQAWERLVDQYHRLIWAVTRDFSLVESDAADVAQVTWLRLLEHIDQLEQPARVGSWLVATARHECLRSVAARKRIVLVHNDIGLNDVAAHQAEVDERLLADERAQVVREALARLPQQWRQMLELLMSDPPASYAEISEQLGLPVGSIGPTRARCLAKLRVLLQAC
jgi:RNA polymerase sigma factor (sigma-70 family)